MLYLSSVAWSFRQLHQTRNAQVTALVVYAFYLKIGYALLMRTINSMKLTKKGLGRQTRINMKLSLLDNKTNLEKVCGTIVFKVFA